MSARRPIGFSPQEISALSNGEVVSRHAEDAAFLWARRDRAARAPNYKLADLVALDERVEAHVDGLRAAGETGWSYALDQLDSERYSEVFVAAVLAFESGDEEKVALALEQAVKAPEGRHAAASALAWGSLEAGKQQVLVLLDDVAEIQELALEAARLLRFDPGPRLAALLREAIPSLRASAAMAVGELGRMDLLQELGLLLRDDDAKCRFAAAWSSAILGIRSPMVLATLREAAVSIAEVSSLAARTLTGCVESGEMIAWYRELRKDPAGRRLAIQVAGFLGDPVLMDDLVEAMGDVALARVAGESFSRITGVDLSFSDLDGDAPDDYDDSAYDDPDDPQVELSYDHDLPWPVRDRVRAWWEDHREDFKEGRRYLLGKPLGLEALHDCLEKGTQSQRASAALLLALHAPGRVMMETMERAQRQLRPS